MKPKVKDVNHSEKESRVGESKKLSPARFVAFEVLRRVETDKSFAAPLLANANLEARDKALAYQLALGVLRWRLRLDAEIEMLAKRKIERLDLAVVIALRIGLYQLRFLEKIPSSAAVNESVELVKRARLKSAAPFVNAVLRAAIRGVDTAFAYANHDEMESLAVEVSHPVWLLRKWIEAFGYDDARALAAANNATPHTAFRISRTDVDANQIIEKLRAAGGEVEESKIVKDAWRVRGATSVMRELVEAGEIYTQTEASQIVAHVVAAKAGERVLDVCAAPGSKTSQIALMQPETKLLVAGDLHPYRLRLMRYLLARTELVITDIIAYDAARKDDENVDCLPFVDEAFDAVLVDAPCSGTGTLQHNPEIKWRVTPQDIEVLSNQQSNILRHTARCVRRGGRLVYSTCSVEPEENEKVIEKFLSDVEGWKLVDVGVNDELVNRKVLENKTARTFPHRDDTEGFFIAKLQRD